MSNKHKYYDVIVAWAGGEKIQFRRDNSEEWETYTANLNAVPAFNCEYVWRVKPKSVTKKYRMALVDDEYLGKSIFALDLSLFSLDFPAEREVQGFIRWVSDIVEVEIEV